MMKKELRTEKAPLPVGPYSQAVEMGDFIFVSGVLPMDPITKILEKDDIIKATKILLNNISAIIENAGLTKEAIIKTTIFMKDLTNFKDVNNVYAEFFAGSKVMPARSTVQVSELPLGAPIEIELICNKNY